MFVSNLESYVCLSGSDANPLASSDLAAFVAAMEVGSVHGAADALGLTASAVTKRLQSLERRLAVTLFDRGRHGLRSTDAGCALYPDAKAALAAIADAQEAVRSHLHEHPHAVAIETSHTIGEVLLPTWLTEFRQHHPDIRLHVDVNKTIDVIAAIRGDDAEIGFVEGAEQLTDLDTLVVHRDQLVGVVAHNHRWSRRRSVKARELRSEPYFAREPGSGTREVADTALAQAGVQLTPTLVFAGTQSLIRALSEGGFTLVSELSTAHQPAGTIHAVPIRDAQLQRELRAIRKPHPRNRLSPETRTFWRWLHQLQARANPKQTV